MHEKCIKVTILRGGWCQAISCKKNVKYECFQWASKYSILLAGIVYATERIMICVGADKIDIEALVIMLWFGYVQSIPLPLTDWQAFQNMDFKAFHRLIPSDRYIELYLKCIFNT